MLVQDQGQVDDNINSENEDKSVRKNSHKNNDEKTTENSICFHWDKDEDLRLLMGGNMYIHPHISTVTYLSDFGAPTMALNYRVNALTGEYVIPSDEESVEGYISWPRCGKHLSFDGRFLHAAPADFMQKGMFKKQIETPMNQIPKDLLGDDAHCKIMMRRCRRVTFLVNIWLNYKPFNVDVFPESMIDKLSKTTTEEVSHILFKNDDVNEENDPCSVKSHEYNESQLSEKCNDFTWSMGSSCANEETISMNVPIELIQKELKGNIKLFWPVKTNSENGIMLSRIVKEEDDSGIKKQRIE